MRTRGAGWTASRRVSPGRQSQIRQLPSEFHQTLLGHLDLHVATQFCTHAKHGGRWNAVDVDDGDGLAAGQQPVKVVDGVFLPRR